MADDVREPVAIFSGSLVIAGGSTIAGVNAFDGRVGWVTLGFLLFVTGYGISQLGVHGDGIPSFDGLAGTARTTIAVRASLVAVGVAGISYGVTTFAQTILHPSLWNAIISGVSSIGGYMVAHVGVNQTGLGWSLFARTRQAITSFRGDRGR